MQGGGVKNFPQKMKKTIDNDPKVLYNGTLYCDNMPFYAILLITDIVAHIPAAVKKKFSILTTEPGVS